MAHSTSTKLGLAARILCNCFRLVTRGGVKVLDFGLAKMAPPKHGTEGDSPTTAAPTSPLFGWVLYEMLTGKRALGGSNAASVIAC